MSEQTPTQIFSVLYLYGSGTDAVRDEHRPAHRDFLLSLGEDMVAAGAYLDDPEQALLLVRGTSAEDVRTRLAEDPFNTHGAIAEARINAWSCAIGTAAPVLRGETA